jgi:predicted dehydrogenase
VYRIGLIGAGWITEVHAAAWLAAADRATVVAVADVNAEAAARLAVQFNAPTFTDYRLMLDETRPDAVDICVPPHLHVAIVSEAASRGIHVLCEKPIARGLEEADQIGAAVGRAGIVYMPAHDTIFYPTVRRAHEYLQREDLGTLSFIGSWECDTDVPPSRFGPPRRRADRRRVPWRLSAPVPGFLAGALGRGHDRPVSIPSSRGRARTRPRSS